jgi:ferredoxin
MTQCLVCSCNKTMPIDETAIGQPVAQALCRHEVGQFLKALETPDDLVVACTQEQPLFSALAEQKTDARATAVRFVNIRETAGWSSQARQAMPKVKALLARAQMPLADPVPSVAYNSSGRLLIIGPASLVRPALALAQSAYEALEPTGFVTAFDLPDSSERSVSVLTGQPLALTGHLGHFELSWTAANPIDLDLCTRCGACQRVCPEGAISDALQVDLTRCQSHRDCVKACDAVGAIRFDRLQETQVGEFDLVIDLRPESFFGQMDAPKGYRHVPAADLAAVYQALAQAAGEVGEFEKPKFFKYDVNLCAHGRNGQVGCQACIDVCSTKAPRSVFENGRGRIEVDPHLCMGCGACSTVCPSGAMRYAYPSADRIAQELRVVAKAYREAGGEIDERSAPSLLIYGQTDELGGAEGLLNALGRQARKGQADGLPAHWIPFGVHHPASLGLECWLAALCYGFGEVMVLLTGEEDGRYHQALSEQVGHAQAILQILGLRPHAVRLHLANSPDALQSGLSNSPVASAVEQPATFGLGLDKRQALDMALEYLMTHGRVTSTPTPLPAPLPAGAPMGSLVVDRDRCTLCMACVGACPAHALKDGSDRPLLAFVERNCVQCGLCVKTCPESALTLEPRLAPLAARKESRVIHESEPFCCIRCGKPFATKEGLRAMLLRIGQHPAFAGEALKRLEMCGDCRVVDMVEKNA